MARKRAIVIGDKTTHGGVVLQGDPSMIVEGKPVALEGDLVACPQCKGNFPIIDGANKMRSNGRRVALEGMKTACGAELIGSQNLMWADDNEPSYNAEIAMFEKTLLGIDDSPREIYKVQFHFKNDEGKPYANMPFSILLPDGERKGKTDAHGFTPIYSTEQAGEVKTRLHFSETDEKEWRWA